MKKLIFPSAVAEALHLISRAKDEIQQKERGDPGVNVQDILRDLGDAMVRVSAVLEATRSIWDDAICMESAPSVESASPVIRLAGVTLMIPDAHFRVKVNKFSFIGCFYELFVANHTGLPIGAPVDDIPKLVGALDLEFPKLINPLVPQGIYRLDEFRSNGKHFYLLSKP